LDKNECQECLHIVKKLNSGNDDRIFVRVYIFKNEALRTCLNFFLKEPADNGSWCNIVLEGFEMASHRKNYAGKILREKFRCTGIKCGTSILVEPG